MLRSNRILGVCDSRLDKSRAECAGTGAVALVAEVAQAVVGIADRSDGVASGVDVGLSGAPHNSVRALDIAGRVAGKGDSSGLGGGEDDDELGLHGGCVDV